jgi:hypothetical protein
MLLLLTRSQYVTMPGARKAHSKAHIKVTSYIEYSTSCAERHARKRLYLRAYDSGYAPAASITPCLEGELTKQRQSF